MALAILIGAAPAMAHSDTGNMTVEVAGGDDSLHPRVRARITYSNDGEPAPAATVNVDAVAADGTVGASATLTSEGNGVYTAAIALPSNGVWTFRVTATNPVATAESAYEAAVPATTTTRPSPSTRLAADDRTQAGSGGDGDSSSGGGTTVAIVAAVAAAVLIGGVATLLVRRRIGNTSSS